MNDSIRYLLQQICCEDNNISKIRKAALYVLENNTSKKDEFFCSDLIKKLKSKTNFIELPYNLKGMLVAEDTTNYISEKYYWTPYQTMIVNKIKSIYYASKILEEKHIRYVPSLLLYGESGCGKTELARYIAHDMNLPYLYVKFSSLVDSHLGQTQKNISNVFDYIKKDPCVVCFDEIDSIGIRRGLQDEVGEMSRIVVSLMQEIDQLSNSNIIIATTNRFDMIDSALLRRFTLQYEIKKLDMNDGRNMAKKFLEYSGLSKNEVQNFIQTIDSSLPAFKIINDCIELLVKTFSK